MAKGNATMEFLSFLHPPFQIFFRYNYQMRSDGGTTGSRPHGQTTINAAVKTWVDSRQIIKIFLKIQQKHFNHIHHTPHDHYCINICDNVTNFLMIQG